MSVTRGLASSIARPVARGVAGFDVSGDHFSGYITMTPEPAVAGESVTFEWVETSVTGGLSASTLEPDEGDEFSLEFEAVSYTFQWRKDDVNIDGATNATFVIANVGVDDNGDYTVLVTDPASGQSRTFGPKTIDVEQVISGTAFPGETLSSGSSGQWSLDGVSIAGETGSTYVVRVNDIGGVIAQVGASNSVTCWHPDDEANIKAIFLGNFNVFNSVSPNVAATDGQSIRRWTGLLGSEANQATAGNRPTYRMNAVAGNSVIEFDGTDDFMPITGLASMVRNVNHALWIIAARDTNRSGGDVTHIPVGASTTSSTATRLTLLTRASSTSVFRAAARQRNADAVVNAEAASADGWHVLTAHAAYISGKLRLRVNGIEVAESNFANSEAVADNDSVTVQLGRMATTGNHFPGQMAACFGISGSDAPSAAAFARLERYAGLLCGLDLHAGAI
jgi:hypothetical protein